VFCTILSLAIFFITETVIYEVKVKVKVSHNRPRWPKEFRVG